MVVGRVTPTTVTRVRHGDGSTTTEQVDDVLVVEEPLSIQLDGRLVATTMRTPGHDFELAAGFCFTDGLLAGAPVTDVHYVPGPDGSVHVDNAVTVDTDGRAPEPRPRLGNVSSSCGWCGSDQIDDLCLRLGPLDPSPSIGLDVLATVPAAVRARQELFDVTGAVHAAAVFDREGRIIVVREDVGRHNAVDKVIGSMLLDGRLPLRDRGLYVSGRASIEMVQKAWSAGLATLLAESAPTALAVESARRADMTLVGFLRADGFNVYSS
ncbi:MAG TPA: formate dehydrogenase accessory sulfurtransferase FdhD [Ilumatobacteraceae bacterium]|nr:formate dehydrogenase accessory sulfurtransferase FdhD [Ilumatobacteraceae bacterium]